MDVHCLPTVVSEETVDFVWINAGLLICCVLLIVYMQRFVYIQRLPTDVKFISQLEIHRYNENIMTIHHVVGLLGLTQTNPSIVVHMQQDEYLIKSYYSPMMHSQTSPEGKLGSDHQNHTKTTHIIPLLC